MEQEARTGGVHVSQARLGDFRKPKTRLPESLFAADAGALRFRRKFSTQMSLPLECAGVSVVLRNRVPCSI